MSFKLRHNQSLRKNIRRIVRKQLQDAREVLSNSEQNSLDERIHSVRKSFKRVRAVVRLVRSSIGNSDYRRENDAFRDAGRPLSAVRDAKVLIEALDKLKKNSAKAAQNLPFVEARTRLLTHRQQVLEKVLQDQEAFKATAAAIEEGLERLDNWIDINGDWQHLGKGIKSGYKRGRIAFDNVKTARSVENLHEWRKQVKYLRHQLELLAPIWPKVVGELASQAEELGELLGEDHDLAVLGLQLKESESVHEANSMDSLAALIDSRRATLQREAIPKGELLYRDRPKQFEERLKAYRKKWTKRSKREPAVVA